VRTSSSRDSQSNLGTADSALPLPRKGKGRQSKGSFPSMLERAIIQTKTNKQKSFNPVAISTEAVMSHKP
jgi:hypothetical protein